MWLFLAPPSPVLGAGVRFSGGLGFRALQHECLKCNAGLGAGVLMSDSDASPDSQANMLFLMSSTLSSATHASGQAIIWGHEGLLLPNDVVSFLRTTANKDF